MRSPSLWIHSDGPWFAQIGVDQHASPAAIRWSHRDGSVARVGPVEVVLNPVLCQPFGGMQIRVDQSNVSRRVARLVDVSTAETCRQLEVLLLDTLGPLVKSNNFSWDCFIYRDRMRKNPLSTKIYCHLFCKTCNSQIYSELCQWK